MRNNLPRKIHVYEVYESGIINLNDNDGPGTHWTAYKKYKDRIIYFDSFGNLRPPVEAIKYFNSNGQCGVLYNHKIYQTYNSYNCGHLCLLLLFNK